MSMKAILIGGVFLAVAAAGTLAWGVSHRSRVRPKPVVQPIAFNHKRHHDEGLSCKDCHKYADERLEATMPSTRACLLCHEEELGKHPDEPKVREFARDGGEIPWIQVNRLVGHVRFSHVAHVKLAGMNCRDCHGDMEKEVEPVTRPQIDHLDMDRCMACHTAKGAKNNCMSCHK